MTATQLTHYKDESGPTERANTRWALTTTRFSLAMARKYIRTAPYPINPAPLRFIRQALQSDTDECIEWPFRRERGYGKLTIGRREWGVHRLVCALAHGLPPAPRWPGTSIHTAHSCDNPPCINPRHLRWATPKENAEDRERARRRAKYAERCGT